MLDRLVRLGLAKRSRDPEDHRCSLATITKPGLALLARLDPEIAAARSVVARSRPAATASLIRRPRPGSLTGATARRIIATLSGSRSTAITSWPCEAKQPAATAPT